MFSKLFFEVPRLPVPKPDEPIVMPHSNNMIVDSLETVDGTFRLFGLLGRLQVVFINGDELTVESSTENLLRLTREIQRSNWSLWMFNKRVLKRFGFFSWAGFWWDHQRSYKLIRCKCLRRCSLLLIIMILNFIN